MENCILFGNGVNRVLSNADTWIDLLENLSKEYEVDCDQLIKSEQYTMVYEQIVASAKVDEFEIKKHISNSLSCSERSKSYCLLSGMNVQNFMTTNYEHHLETELRENGFSFSKDASEKIYSIRRNNECNSAKKSVKIWSIHGSINEPKSIMLGFDHYCGYIGKIDAYIKGTYSYGESSSKKVESIYNKLTENNGTQYDKVSWIEHFFKSNIYILGLGMSYSEIDLWWILNKRARMIINSELKKVVRNKIVYFGDGNDVAKIKLLNSFGVRVVLKKKLESYDDFFKRTLNEIDNEIL